MTALQNLPAVAIAEWLLRDVPKAFHLCQIIQRGHCWFQHQFQDSNSRVIKLSWEKNGQAFETRPFINYLKPY
ncbi:MAG: Uncharacterised protein [Opitutia bacterium UBA7350]|nr:MAG: Uncharacterised protein [Opitutae bacterium UBA7350]